MKKLFLLLFILTASIGSAQEKPFLDLWTESSPYPFASEVTFPEGAEHFIVQNCNEDPDYKFLHETAIGFWKNELILGWYNNFKNELQGKTLQRARRSIDFGKTWSQPEIVMDKDNDKGLMYVGLQFLTLDGVQYLFTNMENGTEKPVDCLLMSYDCKTKNWKEIGPIAERFLAMQQPMMMENGNFVISGSYAAQKGQVNATAPVVYISQGKEIAKPWRRVQIDPNDKVNVFAETAVVVDGRNLLAVTRLESSPFPNFYESNNFGEAWHKIENKTFPAVSSKFAAGKLSNGYRYIIYNLPHFQRDANGKIVEKTIQYRSRDTLVMAVAKPGEKAFSRIWKISDKSGSTNLSTSHYPCLAEHDGQVYICYTGTIAGKPHRVAALTKFPLASLEKEDPDFGNYASWFAPFTAQGISLTDWHIHYRGGMTPEKAVLRAQRTGIKSGILENHGRDWPICDNQKLARFIDLVEKTNAKIPDPSKKLKIGIQVNDRDWYKKIDMKLYRRLDYVLADTMIMDTDAQGKPQKLWLLPKDHQVDPEVWMKRYMEHNLQILEEPIDILANVTYLPKFVEDRYDELWTEARMKAIIQKAIDHGIALEIQAQSDFPKPKFIKLALQMGAKLSFGSNNFDDKMKSTETWKNAFEKFSLKNNQIWQMPTR